MSDLLGVLDSVARVVGWIAIFAGLLWVGGQVRRDEIARAAYRTDRDEQLAFEEFLRSSDHFLFEKYRDLKEHFSLQMLRSEVTWQHIAIEAGVPEFEVSKRRTVI